MSISPNSPISHKIVYQEEKRIPDNGAPHAIEQINDVIQEQMAQMKASLGISDPHLPLTPVGTPVSTSDRKDCPFAIVSPETLERIPQASEQLTTAPLAERVQQIIPQGRVCSPAVGANDVIQAQIEEMKKTLGTSGSHLPPTSVETRALTSVFGGSDPLPCDGKKLASTLPFEVWAAHVFPRLDLTCRLSCSYVTKPWHDHLFKSVKTEVLKLCPCRWMDTGLGEAFSTDPYELGRALIGMGPQIEERAGVTLLIMRQGLTLNHLVQVAAETGIAMILRDITLIQGLEDFLVEQTYGVLISHHVLKGTQGRSWEEQQELVLKAGCELPSIQECVALCIFTQRVFQEYLPEHPMTAMRSSTHSQGRPLRVVSFQSSALHIDYEGSDPGGLYPYFGVMGCRKL